ncbi:hypothetical protein GCM10010873_03440 [Cypionkella aquatica]|uniref:DUF6473 domain-containing protein n=1 Tax=Cypionkella aquatica TaxID=1756042 RepID=A0AA37X1J9_9RHOB|nr:DUF6473 family protein [Cypionkella aquatica]GLS85371.1 hypothetical protein GCM10010873_03440 [Cypionkella aquatica]
MAYVFPGEGSLDYFPCRYGSSRVLFRGPRRDIERAYVAVLGGTETYGKFVPVPFPDLIERQLGMPVVNLGCMNAGPDVFINEAGVTEIAAQASVTVVQVLGALNLSNRYYAVHPRRNDRFLGATPLLRTIFPRVDFTEFNFTRHMLMALQSASVDKFEVVADELRAAWVTRMKLLLSRLGKTTILLWASDLPPPQPTRRVDLTCNPLLIDTEMINAIRAPVARYVQAVFSAQALSQGVDGMAFASMEAPAAAGLPGPAAHQEIADMLMPAIHQLM